MIQRNKALSAILVTAILLFAGCLGQEESPFYGEEIEPIVAVEDFVLFDENGEPYQLSDLEGKVIEATC